MYIAPPFSVEALSVKVVFVTITVPLLYIAPPFPVDLLFFIIESVIVIFATELLLSITEPLPVFSASCIVTFFIFSLTSVPSAILKKLPF